MTSIYTTNNVFSIICTIFSNENKSIERKADNSNTFKTQNFTDRILRLWIPNGLYMKNSFYTVNKLEIIKN